FQIAFFRWAPFRTTRIPTRLIINPTPDKPNLAFNDSVTVSPTTGNIQPASANKIPTGFICCSCCLVPGYRADSVLLALYKPAAETISNAKPTNVTNTPNPASPATNAVKPASVVPKKVPCCGVAAIAISPFSVSRVSTQNFAYKNKKVLNPAKGLKTSSSN